MAIRLDDKTNRLILVTVLDRSQKIKKKDASCHLVKNSTQFGHSSKRPTVRLIPATILDWSLENTK
jgi:hypothetical protein